MKGCLASHAQYEHTIEDPELKYVIKIRISIIKMQTSF